MVGGVLIIEHSLWVQGYYRRSTGYQVLHLFVSYG